MARWAVTWIVLVAAVAASDPAPAVEPPSLSLPGPVSELARAVGFDASTPSALLVVEVLRAAHAAPPGRSRDADALRTRLEQWLQVGAAGRSSPASAGSRLIPAALDPARWSAILPNRPSGSALVPAIVLDRRAALLYVGLRCLDESTLAVLSERSGLLETIYASHAAPFAAFAGALRVVGGRIATPGSADDERLWQEVVGAPPGDVERFVLRLLSEDHGRLAYFFDAVTHLDAARQRFAMQVGATDTQQRRDHLRSLARVFARATADWQLQDHPFSRPAIDAALALQQLAVDEQGRPLGPRSTGFWNAVFEHRTLGLEGEPRTPEALSAPPDVDPAWIIARLAEPDPDTRMARLRAVQFVQRAFPAPATPTLFAVARAAEGMLRYPALPLVLERLGVTQAPVYAQATSIGASLGHSDAHRLDLALFQGSLALIDRVRFSATLDAARAGSLAASLQAAVPLDESRPGWVGAWLDEQFLPALATAGTIPAPAVGAEELTLLAAMAGPSAGATPPVVQWEGAVYRVDPAASELRLLERIRDRQASVSMTEALALHRAVRGLARSATVTTAQLAALDAFTAAVASLPCPEWRPSMPPCESRQLFEEPLRRIRRSLERVGSSRVDRAAVAELSRLADVALADALLGLAYAPHLGQPDDAVTLAPDVARRHQFFPTDRKTPASDGVAWALPREVVGSGVPWHVSGAALALEHALASSLLRRPSLVGTPTPSRLPQVEVLALVRGAARMRPGALADADRDWVADVLGRGRARAQQLLTGARPALAALRDTGWSQQRVNALAWSLETEPGEAMRVFTARDLFRLGLAPGEVGERLAPWGGSEARLAAALENAWPAGSPDAGVHRPTAGIVGGQSVDAVLRALEFLSAERLPAALAPALLASIVTDLVWEAPLGSAQDWFALAQRASTLEDERLQAYVTALTVDGPLVDAEAAARGTDR